MWLTIALSLLQPALAQDAEDDAPPEEACDVPVLESTLKEATPVSTAGAWAELASCAPAKGKATAKAAFGKMLAGDDAEAAVVIAVDLGLGDLVLDWSKDIEAAPRAKTVARLGEACDDVPAVGTWLLTTPESLGERFWKERWYRAFADCRTPEIQAWLAKAVDPDNKSKGTADTAYHDLLQAYARNARAEAIPTLSSLATKLGEADQIAVIDAFGDAANLGSTEGIDEAARVAAVEALSEVASEVSGRAVERARGILESMEAYDEANALARYRWPERMAGDRYGYGAAITQTITCKKGTETYLHLAQFTEGGEAWPDQLPEKVKGALPAEWELDKRPKKCKGEDTLTVVLSSEPWGAPEAWEEFKQLQTRNFEANKGDAVKAEVIEQPSFRL